jgi:hypothetical protein
MRDCGVALPYARLVDLCLCGNIQGVLDLICLVLTYFSFTFVRFLPFSTHIEVQTSPDMSN